MSPDAQERLESAQQTTKSGQEGAKQTSWSAGRGRRQSQHSLRAPPCPLPVPVPPRTQGTEGGDRWGQGTSWLSDPREGSRWEGQAELRATGVRVLSPSRDRSRTVWPPGHGAVQGAAVTEPGVSPPGHRCGAAPVCDGAQGGQEEAFPARASGRSELHAASQTCAVRAGSANHTLPGLSPLRCGKRPPPV